MFHVKHLFSSTRLFHVKHLSASGCLEARRGRSRIASPARAPPVLRIRGAVGARARFYTGASATRRPAASMRARAWRDVLRLRRGRAAVRRTTAREEGHMRRPFVRTGRLAMRVR
ncbi:hypothetical protein K100096D8_11730 [Eggerthella lenta]